MARPRTFNVRKPLVKLFSENRIENLVRETGAVKRKRKVKIAVLFWSVVLGFGTGRERSISGIRRSYEKTTGQRIEESSFYDRFTAGFVKLLKKMVTTTISEFPGMGRSLRGTLSQFSDLVITDGTIMKLHDMLARNFPGVRTNHSPASLKMHAVISVTGKGDSSIKLTPGRRHDGPVFRVGSWVKEKLLLFDLGYYRYQLFSCISRSGGFFVSRLKSFSDLEIVEVNRTCHGRSIALVGERIQTIVDSLKREVIDVMVDVPYRKRPYAGSRRCATQRLRVVGVLNQDANCYHLFITNIPPDSLSAEEIANVYAARWEIELLFRELKSQYRLADLPSRKKHVVEALVYASILTLIASRTPLAVKGTLPRYGMTFQVLSPKNDF
ncbi:MAG: IS4 family transposase [Deltaproteobacteria bacterium]|nr:IS4 family transposase [Deltaproteobacteria bacterium]